MQLKNIFNKKTKIILMACFVAFALSLSLNLITDEALKINETSNGLLKMLIKIERSIHKDTFKTIITFCATFFLLKENSKENKKQNNYIYIKILAILFSLFTIFGCSYLTTASWKLIFNDWIQFIKATIIGVGYYIFYKVLISYIFNKVIPKINYKKSENKVFNFIFEKHSFIIPFAIMIICWLPYIIINYPGILMPDSSNQIRQYFGIKLDDLNFTNSVNLIDENVTITNHHPVVHTLVLGTCLKVGKELANDNFGIFIYTAIQTILLASALAYSIHFMKRLKANNSIRILALAIFALLPVFPFYALEITKDVPFTSLFIFYVIELYKIANDFKEKKISIKRLSLTIFISTMVCLLRNNGLYTILLSLPFFAIVNKVNRRRILCATLIVFILYESFLKIVLPAFKISNTGVREMLSVPFQQTARYVKEYGNEITKKEKKIIDKVLEYDTIAKRYNPERSDAIKNKYNKDATKEDLIKYFKLWAKQFLKHPNVYIESFLNNYYGYVYLERRNVEYIVEGIIVEQDPRINQSGMFNYSYNSNFVEQRKNFETLIKVTETLPVLSWFSNIGLNSWMLLAMMAYLLYKKQYKNIVCLLPAYSIALIYFVSPVNAYFRYALPNMFSIFLMISIFLNVIKKEENKDEK